MSGQHKNCQNEEVWNDGCRQTEIRFVRHSRTQFLEEMDSGTTCSTSRTVQLYECKYKHNAHANTFTHTHTRTARTHTQKCTRARAHTHTEEWRALTRRNARTHTHTHSLTHNSHTNARARVHTHTHKNGAHAHVHTHTHTHTHKRRPERTRTHKHTHTLTHTHTHKPLLCFFKDSYVIIIIDFFQSKKKDKKRTCRWHAQVKKGEKRRSSNKVLPLASEEWWRKLEPCQSLASSHLDSVYKDLIEHLLKNTLSQFFLQKSHWTCIIYWSCNTVLTYSTWIFWVNHFFLCSMFLIICMRVWRGIPVLVVWKRRLAVINVSI
jgi:hypothetical protein